MKPQLRAASTGLLAVGFMNAYKGLRNLKPLFPAITSSQQDYPAP